MATKYEVPEGFRLVSNPDTRTDEEIAALLQTSQPVTSSDKNVWAFWDSGWTGMRPWCQRNIINWVRRLGPEWTVRVLDNVDGSVNNVLNFVPASYFPAAFNDKTMAALPQHLSDLLRLPLLILYGGVWMDAGMVLFRHLDDLCWHEVESPNSPYEMVGMLMALRPQPGPMLNGFIASRRDNIMLKNWHAVYCALWDNDKTNAEDFHKHPLLAHLPPYETQLAELGCAPMALPNKMISDYLAHFLAFERLHHLQDPESGFDGAEYFEKKIFKLRAVDQLYYGEKVTGWDGRKQYNFLATRVGDTDAPLCADAKSFVDRVLRNCALLKFSHGPPVGIQTLASIWDEEAHAEDDIAPGTFADYLRHASIYWELIEGAVKPTILEKPQPVYKARVLEPIVL
jgi:Capsular polysaccharide synthesis protein